MGTNETFLYLGVWEDATNGESSLICWASEPCYESRRSSICFSDTEKVVWFFKEQKYYNVFLNMLEKDFKSY